MRRIHRLCDSVMNGPPTSLLRLPFLFLLSPPLRVRSYMFYVGLQELDVC